MGRNVNGKDMMSLLIQIIGTSKALEKMSVDTGIELQPDYKTRLLRIQGNITQILLSLDEKEMSRITKEADKQIQKYMKMYLTGANFFRNEKIGSWPEFFHEFSKSAKENKWNKKDPHKNKEEFRTWLELSININYNVLEGWVSLFTRLFGDLPGVNL